jgi:hypothetical protein
MRLFSAAKRLMGVQYRPKVGWVSIHKSIKDLHFYEKQQPGGAAGAGRVEEMAVAITCMRTRVGKVNAQKNRRYMTRVF